MSYEKDKLDSYVTSGSLSTALAPYVTSASVSAAIAAAVGTIDLSAYVTSNSLSAAVATDALTVRGAASVSATLSAGAVTVAGRPVGPVLLGYTPLSATQEVRFSGSWSDFAILELVVHYQVESGAASTRPLDIYSDGGTTSFLTMGNTGMTAAANQIVIMQARIAGGNGLGVKSIFAETSRALLVGSMVMTSTANTAVVNCIQYASTATMTRGAAMLYGWRSS